MAADPKDTTVTEDNTEQELWPWPAVATATSPPKKLSAEELIRAFEAAQLKTELPDIYVGRHRACRRPHQRRKQERVQPYEGVVIAKRHGGLNETITVRASSRALAWNAFSCSTALRWLPSRLNGAVKFAGRSFSICVTEWVRPLA